MYFLTGIQLSSMFTLGLKTEDIDFLKHSAILLQNHADQRHGFAGLAGAEEDAGCLLVYSVVGNSLIFPIRLAKIRSREAGRRDRETAAIRQASPCFQG